MQAVKNIIRILHRFFAFLGGVFLIAMIGITCANIFLRTVWKPVPGTYELMGYFGALAAAFALGYTQSRRGHIAVDIIVDLMPDWAKRFLAVINSFLCTVFFGLIAWQVTLKALVMMRTGEVTETLRIIYYPFTFAMAAGCAVMALALLSDFLEAVFPAREGQS